MDNDQREGRGPSHQTQTARVQGVTLAANWAEGEALRTDGKY